MNHIFRLIICLSDKISNVLRRIKIPVRLAASYVLVSTIPIIVIADYSGYILHKSLLEKLNDSSVHIAQSISHDIDRYMEELSNISNGIIDSIYMRKIILEYEQDNIKDKDQISHEIPDYIKNNVSASSLSSVCIMMEDGYKVQTIQQYRPCSEEVRKLEKAAAENDGLPVFLPVQLEDGSKGVTLVRAIRSSDGMKNIGAIYITVAEKSIRELYNYIDLGTDSAVYVFDSSGEMISSNSKEANTDSIDILKGIGTNKQGSFELKAVGEKYSVSYSKVDQFDWYIAYLVPYSYLNSDVKEIRKYIYILVAVCLIFCSILTLVIYKSIAVPLTNLRNHMMNMEKEKHLEKIIDHNQDEIADVAKSYNLMIDKIDGLIEEVHRSEQQKSAEKLKALQAQINPHFISNTLNTVKWMASLQNAENIERLTTSLIQLLQVSMGKVEDLVPLAQEIEYIRNYVEIQSYKYLDKLTVEYDIDREADLCLLPPFSIQPIVENAIIHGIEPKTGRGIIWISTRRIKEEVVCVVKDNGIGFTNDNSLEQPERTDVKYTKGIGIKNANERIKMYFGEDYGITCESVPGIYSKVKVRIPYTIKNKDKQIGDKVY